MARRAARPWEARIRQLVKADRGRGWILAPHRGGRTQISRRWSDGTRSTVTVAVPWAPASSSALLALVERLDSLMRDQSVGLARAAELIDVVGAKGSAAAIREGAVDWAAVAERFQRHQINSGAVTESTWQRTYRRHVGDVLKALAQRPAPRNGLAVLEAVLQANPTPPGMTGRRERIGNASRFLAYAVASCGAPARYAPPISLKPLIGRRLEAKQAGTPLRDDQFLRLYEAVGDPRWRLAVGLLGVFGLRPAELEHCRAEGNHLIVDGVKRNTAGKAKARRVEPLDPIGAKDMGGRLLAVLSERGSEALPKTTVAAYWSTRLQQHFVRHVPAWSALLEEAKSTGQGHLTVYSLRHGYAWRGGQTYGISPRVLAALMGHTVAVHLRHYGEGAAADEVAAAVAVAKERIALLSE